jgi:uncharacterized protein (DUF433 family)
MMTEQQIRAHITCDPAILRGKPIIRGTRVPVYLIADFVANGATPAELVTDYPDLTLEDVEAALAFAAQERAETEVHRG